MIFPSEKEFFQLTKLGNLIPVYREILGDLETPVSAYLKLSHGSSYSFLLESVEGEEKIARYSFLAKDPELVLETKGHRAFLIKRSGGKTKREEWTMEGSPLDFLRGLMAKYQPVEVKGLPRFCGGFVGSIGYDVVRFYERLPDEPVDDLGLPDMIMMLTKKLVIFDQCHHKIKIVVCAHIDHNMSRQKKSAIYRQALKQIEAMAQELRRPLPVPKIHQRAALPRLAKSNVTRRQFLDNVKNAKKKIKAGDIIQVVISQRFQVPVSTEPIDIYRRLRTLNPSPYMYYLHFDDINIIGSSPEPLLRCEGGTVETRPIAGTRRRGLNDQEDEQLMKELMNDPKEKAEHIMLVDLGRNDLGRVCEKGSVTISEFMTIEKYSHVMHIVSHVKGRLRRNKDSLDAFMAAFPAGTVSGAPKIRAMEIIDELENRKRGPYAGCIGYIGFSGNLDTCITIRTIIVVKDKAYIQAGAGIVADSVPEKEYQETINKARAQILAIEMAHQSEP